MLQFSSVCHKRVPAFAAVFSIFLLAFNACSLTQTSDSVLTFLSPTPFTILRAPSCTVAVATKVPVVSVELYAQYYPQGSSDPVLVSIGHLTSPPYRVLWNTGSLPNQLLTGASIHAEALMPDGTLHTTELSGIFILNHPLQVPQAPAPYAGRPGSRGLSLDLSSRHLLSSSIQARVLVSWNDKGITYSLDCIDPHYRDTLPESVKKLLGLRVALDAAAKRTPYLTKKVWLVTVPLSGSPFRTTVQAGYRTNGSFGVRQEINPIEVSSTVSAADGRGYTAVLTLPFSQLFEEGKHPSSLACNVLATVIDEDGAVRELSWVVDPQNLSPYTYGQISLQRRSSAAMPYLVLFLCALIGFVMGAAIMILLKRAGPRRIPVDTSLPDADADAMIRDLEAIINAEFADPSFVAATIPERIAVLPATLAKLVRKRFGHTLADHLLKARVEMAKERFRSSHAGEATVAKHCGFASVDEMERGFRKFVRQSPHQYREENKVG